MGYSTTEGKLYIVELSEPFDRLAIQFVPEQIVMDRRADVADFAIVGRNNPLHQYTGGDEKMTLQLDFVCDDESRSDVITKCRWLQSLAQNDAGRRPQTLIKLIWGDLFQRSKWVVNSAKVTLTLFDKRYGFLPTQGIVDLSLSLDTKENIPKSDLRDRTYGKYNAIPNR